MQNYLNALWPKNMWNLVTVFTNSPNHNNNNFFNNNNHSQEPSFRKKSNSNKKILFEFSYFFSQSEQVDVTLVLPEKENDPWRERLHMSYYCHHIDTAKPIKIQKQLTINS